MINIQNKEGCCGCKSCEQICPKNCVSMKVDNEGFWYPIVNKELCVDCGLCEKVCPELLRKEPITPIVCYACYTSDEQVRLKSSSGGVFTLLAEYVIAQQGVVFGAKFDDQWNVVHSYTDSISGLSEFRGSKYVQSDIGSSFIQVRAFLQQGRKVLFSGTPCQVSGLNLYLKKNYENLLTMDFICHGVPSPKVWTKYLNSEFNSIHDINFRAKTLGWDKFSLNINYLGERKYNVYHWNNPYMRGFLKDLYLRPSCHKCKSKSLASYSDITVGDFWGIDNVLSGFSDNKGVSCILVNSSKMVRILEGLKAKMTIRQVEYESIVVNNKSLVISAKPHRKRAAFFEKIDVKDICLLLTQYTQDTLSQKARKVISLVLRKVGLFNVVRKVIK